MDLEKLLGTVLDKKEYDGPATLTLPNSRELSVRCHFTALLKLGTIQDPRQEIPRFILGVYWDVQGWMMTEPPELLGNVTFFTTEVMLLTIPTGLELELYNWHTSSLTETSLDFDSTILRFRLMREYKGKSIL